jgi:4-oxalocrotonate tautomerase family enzyme
MYKRRLLCQQLQLHLIKQVKKKKKQLIKNLTREASKITGYPPEFFFVYIQEFPTENIGVGGKTGMEIKNQKKK